MNLGFGYADPPPVDPRSDGADYILHTVCYLTWADRWRLLASGSLHVILRGATDRKTGRMRLTSSHKVPWERSCAPAPTSVT